MPLWTTEIIDALKVGVAKADFSADGIASILNKQFNLNLTRNAVIGKVNRLGLCLRGRGRSNIADRPRRPPIERKAYRVMTTKLAPLPPPKPEPVIIAVVDSAALGTGLISIFDLKPTSCRWPHGNATPFLYCGQSVCNNDPNESYCLGHAQLAYMKSTPRSNFRPFRRAA